MKLDEGMLSMRHVIVAGLSQHMITCLRSANISLHVQYCTWLVFRLSVSYFYALMLINFLPHRILTSFIGGLIFNHY